MLSSLQPSIVIVVFVGCLYYLWSIVVGVEQLNLRVLYSMSKIIQWMNVAFDGISVNTSISPVLSICSFSFVVFF